MKISILCDDVAKSGFLSEHGLSLLIDDAVVFDTGSSDVAIKNAEKLRVNLGHVKKIIISHGHYDHMGGLLHFLKNTGQVDVYIHQKALIPKYSGSRFAGPPYNWEDVEKISNVHLLNGDTKVDDFDLINEIKTDPAIIDKHFNVNGVQDTFEDEINLFKDGVLITGCAHRGIEYILEEVRKTHTVHTVIGGFHLKDAAFYRIEMITKKFQEYKLKVVPLHCTGELAIEFFKKKLKEKCILKKAGDTMFI